LKMFDEITYWPVYSILARKYNLFIFVIQINKYNHDYFE